MNVNAAAGGPRAPLLSNDNLRAAPAPLVWGGAGFSGRRGGPPPDPPFLDQVPLDFGIALPSQHYHVPLVCTPWTYSTYRGS